MRHEKLRRITALLICAALLFASSLSHAAPQSRHRQHVREQKKTEVSVSLIAAQPKAVSPMIVGESGTECPIFTIETSAPEGAAVSCAWTLDGVSAGTGTALTLDSCGDLSLGVHTVQCHVSCLLPGGQLLAEDSAAVSWIKAAGVIPDSVLAFSDVHEDYAHIGRAIGEIMADSGGKIPALILCSGDWTNGRSADGQEDTDRVIPALLAQCGGIDTVFTAGNHDSREAALIANAAREASADTAGIASQAEGISVFSIHFEDVVQQSQRGGKACSYAAVLEKLETFLQQQASAEEKPLVVISSHTGLHALGIQPESSANAWAGSSQYHADLSDQVVELLNRYAEDYGLQILFLFGHNHSKGETEFALQPGDTICSTSVFSLGTWQPQMLKFTYAHTGYLTDSSGGTGHYTFLVRTGEGFTRLFRKLGSE